MRIRINIKTLLIISIICLPLSLSLELNLNMPVIGYTDEIIALFMIIYLFYMALKNRLNRGDFKILLFLVLFSGLGILSNVSSGVTHNIPSIMLDLFAQWKIFAAFFSAKYIAMDDSDNYILDSIYKICKLLLILSTICGFISIFRDIGMADSSNTRYGLPAYYFVFGNSGRFGIVVALCLLIILRKTELRREVILYEILAVINMLLTTKGVVYIIIVIYISLRLLFSHIAKTGRFSIMTAVPTVIAGVLASSYQITAYLLDDKAPRALLIKYGFITAKRYFPFGSGFATYGSSEAVKHYSKLYREYGWTHKWSMGMDNGDALNDNYLATIVGETGYIGLVIFLKVFYDIFKQINNIVLDNRSKALILSLFFDMMVCFIGTGITKSSIGVLAFLIMGVFVGLDYLEEEEYYE